MLQNYRRRHAHGAVRRVLRVARVPAPGSCRAPCESAIARPCTWSRSDCSRCACSPPSRACGRCTAQSSRVWARTGPWPRSARRRGARTPVHAGRMRARRQLRHVLLVHGARDVGVVLATDTVADNRGRPPRRRTAQRAELDVVRGVVVPRKVDLEDVAARS